MYAAPTRDLLLRLSQAGLYHARWTERINEEWILNLLKNRPDLTRDRLEYTCDLMSKAIPDALIKPTSTIKYSLNLPDKNDEHILLAAITGRVNVIITHNIKDFPKAILQKYHVIALTPDAFIYKLIHKDLEKVAATVRSHRLILRNPPKTKDEYLDTLKKQQLHLTVDALRQIIERI